MACSVTVLGLHTIIIIVKLRAETQAELSQAALSLAHNHC